MNFDKLNPFKKKEVGTVKPEVETTNASSASDTEVKLAEAKPKLTLEEELAQIEAKRKEIEDLIKDRHEYYLNAKSMEEKINMAGLTKDKQKDTRRG